MLEDLDSLYGPSVTDIQNPGNGNRTNYGQNNNPQYNRNTQNNGYAEKESNNGGGNYNGGGNNSSGGRADHAGRSSDGNSYSSGNGSRSGNYGSGSSYNNGGNRGGYNNRSGMGGNRNFQKKEEVIEEPYVSVAIFIDRDFPDEIKKRLLDIGARFMAKNIHVRYNADDPDIYSRMHSASASHSEAYVPWKNFNQIESKHNYNTETSKHIAASNFQGWDKVPDLVKSMMARNVRMIFGDKNRSTSLCLITWSPDGATKPADVTKETGRSSFIIKLASTYGISVINIAKPNPELILEKAFGI